MNVIIMRLENTLYYGPLSYLLRINKLSANILWDRIMEFKVNTSAQHSITQALIYVAFRSEN